jgi:hypothetical protein
MGEESRVHKILVGIPEENKPSGIVMHRLEDNTETDLKEMGQESMCYISVAEDKDKWWAHIGKVVNHCWVL